MSAHVVRIEWHGHSFPAHTVVCNEPPEALCRAQWDCGCEEFAAVGIGADGIPWHELTDGYLTDEQRAAGGARHYGRHGGECNYALWINASNDVDEAGHGTADIPVTFTWDGDDYEWHVAETRPDPAAAELRDCLDALDDARTEAVLDTLLRSAPDLAAKALRELSHIDPDAVTDALNENGVTP